MSHKSYDALLKENAELKKEIKRLTSINPVKKIDIKLSHNNFYLSSEWKKLRYKKLTDYIKTSGRICECCRNVTQKLHVDHIQPRSKRPDLELDYNNLQILCEVCNEGKSNSDSVKWSKFNCNEWDF